MNNEHSTTETSNRMKTIAVIGSGISGLTAARLLSAKHQVTVFEKNDRLGGHTATVDIERGGIKYAIDTGFIVFNNKTYPNFLALLRALGVNAKPTEMSFSVHNPCNGFEYNGHNLNTLFSQRKNLISPRFWGFIREIVRFNNLCKRQYFQGHIPIDLTLGDFLKHYRFSPFFNQHYVLPMGAAIWSSSLTDMSRFQLRFFVQFFYNHGLLNINDRPQWYVIPGGSREYIAPLIEPFKHRIETSSTLVGITRHSLKGEQGGTGVTLHFSDGPDQEFDEVVLACHSDQALALLYDATDLEKDILAAIPYQDNDVVLHTDETLLPNEKLSWASWNYRLSKGDNKPSRVTYNMNILQGIDAPETFCVSLNQTKLINPKKIIRRFTYAHPVFNQRSLNAQRRRNSICGLNNTHFAGAYWYNGFHEDGVNSALDVARRFNLEMSVL